MPCSHCKKVLPKANLVVLRRYVRPNGEIKKYFYCLTCRKAANRKYLETPAGRTFSIKNFNKYLSKPLNRWKHNQRQKVSYALRIGKITRPSTCSKCKEANEVQAHHEDYTKPLDIIWLCKSCHVDIALV